MIAQAEDHHMARQARLARRSRTARQKTRRGPPRTQAEIERPSENIAALAVTAAGTPEPSADGSQGCELALAERGNTRA
jgi:hypothetical protein